MSYKVNDTAILKGTGTEIVVIENRGRGPHGDDILIVETVSGECFPGISTNRLPVDARSLIQQ